MVNQLILGDSLDILKKWYYEGKRKFIDLVYNDPPFNSNRNYNILFDPETNITEEAFKDTWSTIKYFDLLEDFKSNDPSFYDFLKTFQNLLPNDSLRAYTTIMGIIYWYIHKMIKDTGSLYHHCDPTTSHYIKIILDRIFGFSNFGNEIIWQRCLHTASSKARSKYLAKNHDVILWYTKTKNYKFNKPINPFTDYEVKWRFPHDDNDGMGPYHWNTASSIGKEKLQRLLNAGHAKLPTRGGKKPSIKVFLQNHIGGLAMTDIWTDVDPVPGSGKERIGYPTQKPEGLLERIIQTSTNENDLVADFFNGGGTTPASAIKLKRRFVCIDINHRAIQLTKERFEKLKLITKKDYYIMGIPKSSKELRELVDQNIFGKQKNSKFALEEITIKWYLDQVTGNEKQVADNSIDGRFSFTYQEETRKGIVQITSSANKNHFKAFCLEVMKGTGDIGVYITFEDTLTKGIIKEAKEQGRFGSIDRVQILTFENLIDNQIQYQLPEDIMRF